MYSKIALVNGFVFVSWIIKWKKCNKLDEFEKLGHLNL